MATTTTHSFASNVALLKGRASKYAYYGVVIGLVAIAIATAMVSLYNTGAITLPGIIDAQKNNGALWALDSLPFLFALWGQHVSSMVAYEGAAMVMDQTIELQARTTELEKQAMHDSTHDHLTDLPNRVLLRDRLDQALHAAQHARTHLAVLVIDLDHFKDINDTLGPHHGDRLLKQVAARLQGTVQETATVARLGGDEFAVLLTKISSVKEATHMARTIGKALQTPFGLEGLKLDVQGSIGIAVFPEHGPDADTLLQRADVALYMAKKQRSGRYVVYDPKLDEHSPHKLTLLGELRHAIEADQLVLHYQPKLKIKEGQITEAEALVRWQHPRHDLMRPDEFIPLAERTGLIKDLTLWVLTHALQQHSAWKKLGLDIGVAVNLSAHGLLDLELPDLIAGKLASHNCAPDRLILEITETAIMVDQERALQMLTRLSDMGVRLSIDDFGTGYSSLAQLSKLPVDEIKIDKSFVLDMSENPKDAKIVKATVGLARDLGLEVIAEGTESEQTYEQLRRWGCDAAQGYFISKPVPAKEFTAWVQGSAWKGRATGAEPEFVRDIAEEVVSVPKPPKPDKESIASTIKEIENFIGQVDLPPRGSRKRVNR